MAMNDDLDCAPELQGLYRATARERTSAAVDAAILQRAREQARRNRWRMHFLGLGVAAAAVLVVIVGEIWQRQRADAASLRARYAAITRPYLLDPQASESPAVRTARYLLERRELEQPSQTLGDLPLDRLPKGT
jgi:hypothetical protein